MAKIILVTGSMVAYAYLTEFFTAWYSGNPWEKFQFLDRQFGSMAWCGWTMLICNALVPQLFWFKWARRNIWAMFTICILAERRHVVRAIRDYRRRLARATSCRRVGALTIQATSKC